MRRSALSPHTSDLTELMIFLFFSVSAVSLAMLSWSMMGSQDLMGIQVESRGQLEMESRDGNEGVKPSYTEPDGK